MFKGLKISRKERITHQVMSPLATGQGYTEIDTPGFAWMCDDCGRVWVKQWQAVRCGECGHPDRITQRYGRTYTENGVLKGGYTIDREPIRKETTPTPAPPPRNRIRSAA
jgi:hypothetical protein